MPSRLSTPRPPSLPIEAGGLGADDAVHRRGEQRQLEAVRTERPGDVDVVGIARPPRRDDRDVVESVGATTLLAAADLDFHGNPEWDGVDWGYMYMYWMGCLAHTRGGFICLRYQRLVGSNRYSCAVNMPTQHCPASGLKRGLRRSPRPGIVSLRPGRASGRLPRGSAQRRSAASSRPASDPVTQGGSLSSPLYWARRNQRGRHLRIRPW